MSYLEIINFIVWCSVAASGFYLLGFATGMKAKYVKGESE